MKRLAQALREMEISRSDSDRVASLLRYFSGTDTSDRCWAVHLLTRRGSKRIVSPQVLREWACAEAGIPQWLFDASREATGDLAETIAYLLPGGGRTEPVTLATVLSDPVMTGAMNADAVRGRVLFWWQGCDPEERWLLNRLLTGTFRFRPGISVVASALAGAFHADPVAIVATLSGEWEPQDMHMDGLLFPPRDIAQNVRPYPFAPHVKLETGLEEEDPAQWVAEWLPAGERVQVVMRGERITVWSAIPTFIPIKTELGRELRSKFPDGTVVEGVLTARTGDEDGDREKVTIIDILGHGGRDVRALHLRDRAALIQGLIHTVGVETSMLRDNLRTTLPAWHELENMRNQTHVTGGILVRRWGSPYGASSACVLFSPRRRSIRAILLYAVDERRQGKDVTYAFGVRDRGKFVTVARITGLKPAVRDKIEAMIQRNLKKKAGPVRMVDPCISGTISFSGVLTSPRPPGIRLREPIVESASLVGRNEEFSWNVKSVTETLKEWPL